VVARKAGKWVAFLFKFLVDKLNYLNLAYLLFELFTLLATKKYKNKKQIFDEMHATV